MPENPRAVGFYLPWQECGISVDLERICFFIHLKKDFIFVIFSVCCPRIQKKALIPSSGITSGCDLPDVGAGNPNSGPL